MIVDIACTPKSTVQFFILLWIKTPVSEQILADHLGRQKVNFFQK